MVLSKSMLLIHSLLQDGRLRSGDHILRIGDTDLHGLGSEQVAQVLRQCGNRIKLLITRATVDNASPAPVALPTVTEQQVNLKNTLTWHDTDRCCWKYYVYIYLQELL